MYNAVLDAVYMYHSEARTLWRRAFEDGIYPEGVEREERGAPLLDLHDLSEGASETALRWWLEKTFEASRAKRFTIVTGWGKSRGLHKDGDVRSRAIAVLVELGVPLVPVQNRGMLFVDAWKWRRDRYTYR